MATNRVGVAFAAVALTVGLWTTGCSPLTKMDDGEAQLPYELTAEECDNLIEVSTESVELEKVDGPSAAQLALDAASPDQADLTQYQLTFAVEQSFENLLQRPMQIEEVTTTLSDPESETSYDATYESDAPIELGPHESRLLTFHFTVRADRLSSSYLLGLVEGTALGMTIAPVVRITVPDSDNCGYPDGMIVQAKQGTVEVTRPVETSPVLEVFGAILKAAGHA